MKRIFVGALLLLLAVGVGVGAKKLYAGTGETMRGWGWGGGAQVGVYPPADGTNTGVRWISFNNISSGGAIPFGVNVPSGNGPVTGYAWGGGDNTGPGIGWISFNAGDLSGCPSGTCSASRVGNVLTGWARIIAICDTGNAGNSHMPDGQCNAGDDGFNAGGWSGWLKLSGATHGVTLDTSTNKFSGFAYSDELGWVNFALATYEPAMSLVICPAGSTILNIGQTVQLNARYGLAGTFDCNNLGASVDVTGVAVWTTSNAAVATVAAGQVTGQNVMAVSSAQITATHLATSDTVSVTVNPCAPLGQAAACAASPQYDLTCKDGTNSYQVVDCGTTYDCDGNRKCDFNEVEKPQ